MRGRRSSCSHVCEPSFQSSGWCMVSETWWVRTGGRFRVLPECFTGCVQCALDSQLLFRHRHFHCTLSGSTSSGPRRANLPAETLLKYLVFQPSLRSTGHPTKSGVSGAGKGIQRWEDLRCEVALDDEDVPKAILICAKWCPNIAALEFSWHHSLNQDGVLQV